MARAPHALLLYSLQLNSGVRQRTTHTCRTHPMAAWQADFTLEPDLRPLPQDFREQLDELLPPRVQSASGSPGRLHRTWFPVALVMKHTRPE